MTYLPQRTPEPSTLLGRRQERLATMIATRHEAQVPKMNRSLATTIGAAVLLTGVLSAQSAVAAERGFYVGVYYGQTEKDSDQTPYVSLAGRNYESFGFIPQSTDASFDSK